MASSEAGNCQEADTKVVLPPEESIAFWPWRKGPPGKLFRTETQGRGYSETMEMG
jgi:hypothetical protein